MYDINKAINNQGRGFANPDCHLPGLADWSEAIAAELARWEGIVMTPEHWEVVCLLRDYYGECGDKASGREALRMLEDAFGGGDARKRLFRLFPGGPVRQGCHIAGLPPFALVCDKSFGSIH